MEVIPDSESLVMIEESVVETLPIDPKRARFPCCIVWTTLPVISWLIPFIGHIGICREDGVILDFAGPNYVCVDNFAFGAVTRYLQISKEKCCISKNIEPDKDVLTWDGVLRKSTQEFQHRSYSLLTCNCHSFVANNLNRLGFRSGGWNVVNLALVIFFNARWVSRTSILLSFLPFGVIFSLGLAFGGFKFLTYLSAFAFVLVGWFLLGTYCFKSLIQL